MQESLKKLTDLEFNTLCIDDKILSNIRYAHECVDKDYNHICYKAFGDRNVNYSVTREQIDRAVVLYNTRKQELLKEHNEKFIMVGMGMEYDNPLSNGIKNHRVRATFKNNDGVLCFIEFTANTNNKDLPKVIINHAIYNYVSNSELHINNYKGLERLNNIENAYTKDNLLSIINDCFNCGFTDLVVLNYIVSPEDFINEVL
ncbi:hypothetical protein [Methanoculleus sp.]|uniref:hypothetical protein n=1 Tax=Methanoculleus sp. TaxID=90427 RepID=UPI0025E6F7A0|nr:hypothetical protein [Methanoculleus sp.]MCK9320117.1 hypothetical protein [Methanoculleus sp.]